MANTISTLQIKGVNHYIASSAYAVCTTSSGTAAKVASIQGEASNNFTLYNGITVHIRFQYTNTASNVTLNINNTGAKPLYIYGTTRPGTTEYTSWKNNTIVTITYDSNLNAYLINSYYEKNISGTSGAPAGTDIRPVGTTMSTGAAEQWARVDHVHNIALATGDNNGQVKIAGTNVAVKGLAAAAYSDRLTSLTGNESNASAIPSAKAVVDYLHANYPTTSQMQERPAAAYSHVAIEGYNTSSAIGQDTLKFIAGQNINLAFDSLRSQITINSTANSAANLPWYTAQQNSTTKSVVTRNEKYQWNKKLVTSTTTSSRNTNKQRLIIAYN